MFTGLIELSGRVFSNTPQTQGYRLCMEMPVDTLIPGESIAVNGVCLTYVPQAPNLACFDVSVETLDKTTLGGLIPGQLVHLERAMPANGRFGGHFVTGHVDTTATLLALTPCGEFMQWSIGEFAIPSARFLVPKGSIALDGVSLTVNTADKDTIGIMLVPHTLEKTFLGQCKPGYRFNVEFDCLVRIVAHQLACIGH